MRILSLPERMPSMLPPPKPVSNASRLIATRTIKTVRSAVNIIDCAIKKASRSIRNIGRAMKNSPTS